MRSGWVILLDGIQFKQLNLKGEITMNRQVRKPIKKTITITVKRVPRPPLRAVPPGSGLGFIKK